MLSNNSKQLLQFFSNIKLPYPLTSVNNSTKHLQTIYHDILEAFTNTNANTNINIKKTSPLFPILHLCTFKTPPVGGVMSDKGNSYHALHKARRACLQKCEGEKLPAFVQAHLLELEHKQSFYEAAYTFVMFERKCTVVFIKPKPTHKMQQKMHKCIQLMKLWLYILCKYSFHNSSQCSQDLTIYFYMTSLKKQLPKVPVVLGESHVNTAFTTSCPRKGEIVIYRQQEWFKVFVHETFHCFGWDFSEMNAHLPLLHQHVRILFQVDSKVNLYEAYAEFWAQIINASVYSFLSTSAKSVQGFVAQVTKLLQAEQRFGLYQMSKILRYMNLEYTDLFDKTKNKHKFQEESNILSYYIIKSVFMQFYPELLDWCAHHNQPIYKFTNTPETLDSFYSFLESKYQDSMLLANILFLSNVKCLKRERKKKTCKKTCKKKQKTLKLKQKTLKQREMKQLELKQTTDFLENNLYMSLIEMDFL